MIMRCGSGAASLAALSFCESILLSLIDNAIIDKAEAKGILTDAAAAHRDAASQKDGEAREHEQAAMLLEAIRDGGNSVRRTRPSSADSDSGAEEELQP